MAKMSNMQQCDTTQLLLSLDDLEAGLEKLESGLGFDPDAIVLLALSRIELNLTPSQKLIDIVAEYASVWLEPDAELGDRNLDDEHMHVHWLGALACTLLMFQHKKMLTERDLSYDFQHRDGWIRTVAGNIRDQFGAVILLATKRELHDGIDSERQSFFKTGTLDLSEFRSLISSSYQKLIDELSVAGVFNFNRMQALLRDAADKYAHASYILGLLGDSSRSWFEVASNQKFILATYRIAFGVNSTISSRDALAHLANMIDHIFDITLENKDNIDDIPLPLLRAFAKEVGPQIRKLSDIAANDAAIQAAAKESLETIQTMMAMFAHKFRGPVDSILFNSHHLHDERIYVDAANTMNGLLDTFSLISAEPERLRSGFYTDEAGEGSPSKVLQQSILLSLIQLMSPKSRRRMSPHYLAYAKRHGMAPSDLKLTAWCAEKQWNELETDLQTKWEQEIGHLAMDSSLSIISNWMSQHITPLSISGVEESKKSFALHGSKASIFVILLTELLLNAIKHSSFATLDPICVHWDENADGIEIVISNSSTRESRMREASKGSGRGHNFLKIIMKNLGGSITPAVLQDRANVMLKFPAFQEN